MPKYHPISMLKAVHDKEFIALPKDRQIELLKFWLDNATEALKLWRTVPAHNVAPALGTFREGSTRGPHTCNTVACFGGWLVAMPHFRNLGIAGNKSGSPRFYGPVGKLIVQQYRFASDIFGDEPDLILFGSKMVFEPCAGNEYDTQDSDHRVVIDRLEMLIQETNRELFTIL